MPVLSVVGESELPILYSYDFVDNWRHLIGFETFAEVTPTADYPRCIGGERKCPPEDCGGPGGFESFLEAIRNKRHPEHESYLEWAGGAYDPADFDPKSTQFADPAERLELALGDRL